jgi:membrane associated rhomboid family serine protease
MGEADRYQEYGDERRGRSRILLGQGDNALVWLVAINVMVFLTLLFIKVIYNFGGSADAAFEQKALPYFQLPASFTSLAGKPWTLLTYMFSETSTGRSVFNLLGNMLWLWSFGYILQDITGNRKLIPVFIYGGLLGGLFFISAHTVFPALGGLQSFDALMGANAAVTAVAVAATALAPGYRFFRNLGGGIPIWVLTAVYLLVAFAGLASFGAARSFSIMGGALAGYLFVLLLRKGKDGSVWMNNFYDWVTNLFNPGKKEKSKPEKGKVFYNAGDRKPYSKTSNITQQRVDEILDKINQKGYYFLTDEEKSILKKAAEEDL